MIGLALFTLLGVGIRLLMMVTIQQRRERMNRQINERLRTLIAAYKTLGGSFTGDLTVDPTHLRDFRRRGEPVVEDEAATALGPVAENAAGPHRTRRIRDAVEAALSDIILLGTEEHVRLAERAARELIAGHPIHTHELVISLRSFIRKALDLDPIPADLAIPMQGPTRPSILLGAVRENVKKKMLDKAVARGWPAIWAQAKSVVRPKIRPCRIITLRGHARRESQNRWSLWANQSGQFEWLSSVINP